MPVSKQPSGLPCYKICVTGAPHVGKTSLLDRFCKDIFTSNYVATSGIQVKEKVVELCQVPTKLYLCDFSGQSRFSEMTNATLRAAHGVIIVFDVTNEDSFNRLEAVFKDVTENALKDSFKLLVGNKCEQEGRRVSFATAKEYAAQKGMRYLETSAEYRIRVDEVFMTLALDIQAFLCGQNNGVSRQADDSCTGF